MPNPPPSPWNWANALTALRVLLVPVFVWLLFRDGGDPTWNRLFATVAFVLAILTDKVDGEIARRHNLVTNFGKLVDPIADKALTGAAFISLSLLAELAWWVTVVVVVRELAVTLLRFWVIRHGVIPASRGGKAKTTLQSVALALYLLPLGGWAQWIAVVVMAAAVVVTVLTGLDYVLRAFRLRSASRSAAGTVPTAGQPRQ